MVYGVVKPETIRTKARHLRGRTRYFGEYGVFTLVCRFKSEGSARKFERYCRDRDFGSDCRKMVRPRFIATNAEDRMIRQHPWTVTIIVRDRKRQ